MQKTKYFTRVYQAVVFFCSKRCQIKFNNKKNYHTAEIDYKDFMKIYKECTKELFTFLHYPLVIFQNLEKICFNLIKITVADQIKILDKKSKQNKAQLDLDRKPVKTSAFTRIAWTNMSTGEGRDLKPSTVEQGTFEYSPLGTIFNKRLIKTKTKKKKF